MRDGRDRVALARGPVPDHAARRGQLVGRVVQSAAPRPGPGGRPGASRPRPENARAMAWNASKSVRVCHGGAIAGLNACTNGCMSVLDRSCFSYQVAAGSTTSENSVVEVIRKSSDSSRSSLPSGASSRQRTSPRPLLGPGVSVARSDASVPSRWRRKYSLPLRRGAEQVGPPHGEHPRPVLRRVGVLAGEPEPALAQRLDHVRRPGRPGRPPAPRRPGRAGCGRTSGWSASSPAGPTGPAGRRCAAPANAPRAQRGGERAGVVACRSATGRCAGTSTRCRSSAGAGATSPARTRAAPSR